MFSYEILDYAEDFMSVVYIPCAACENNSDDIELPIVVLPVEAQINNTLRIEAQNKTNLPIVAQDNKVSMRGNSFLLGLLGFYKQYTRWIDRDKSEKTAGVLYVDIGRLKSLASNHAMTCERLTRLKSSANLQYRRESVSTGTSCASRTENY